MKTTVIVNLTGFGNLLGLANRKKIRSFFAYLKSCCNFAMSNIIEGEQSRLLLAGFFYACTKIYGVIPVRNYNEIAALKVLDNGSVTPFSVATIKNNSEMSNTETNAGSAKHSSVAGTQAERNAAGKREFFTKRENKVEGEL
ncbi:MAG: hypothetical protein LBJ63_11170 [Prevotellaceae bacterium]|jgi:hypothetical protein|nr:hypothetical protein [Prevotellaceae bacterium]